MKYNSKILYEWYRKSEKRWTHTIPFVNSYTAATKPNLKLGIGANVLEATSILRGASFRRYPKVRVLFFSHCRQDG